MLGEDNLSQPARARSGIMGKEKGTGGKKIIDFRKRAKNGKILAQTPS